MNTMLANEIIALWVGFEELAHRLGIEVHVESCRAMTSGRVFSGLSDFSITASTVAFAR